MATDTINPNGTGLDQGQSARVAAQLDPYVQIALLTRGLAFQPSMLRARAGFAKVRSGTGNMTLAIGPNDSNGRGTGSTADGTQGYNGWANKLAAHLKARGINAVCDNFFGTGGYSNNFATYDNRITLSRQAIAPALGAGLPTVGGAMFLMSQASDSITFTPKSNCQTLDLYFFTVTGNGTFSWSVDGGGATNVTTSASGGTLAKLTIPLGALATTHSVTVAWVSGNVYFVGMDAYDNSATRVHVWNWGWHGSRLEHWLPGNGRPESPVRAIPEFFKPDLIIGGALVTNDAGLDTAISTYRDRFTTLMTACKSASDLILLTGCPHPTKDVTAYVDVQKDVAQMLGAPIADEFSWFNKSEALAEAAGLFSAADHLHKTGAGHQVTADKLDAMLRLVA